MTNGEAKFILNAYRPNGSDASDEAFGGALEQARQDPALGAWFQWQQRFDRAMIAKLGESQPPAGLREAILAGAKLSRPESKRRGWWNQPSVLAIAASLTVLLVVTAGLLWPKNVQASTTLVEFALTDSQRGYTHGGHGPSEVTMRTMLGEPDRRLSEGLPVNFAELRASGCRTVNFQGRDVIEICFKRNGAWFHCYIALRSDFPELGATTTPTIFDRQGGAVAAWCDLTHVFLVASKGGSAALQKLL